MLSRQLAHQRTLAHGREADEANTGHTSSGNIKSYARTTTTAAGGLKQLPLELSEFRLQLPCPSMSMLHMQCLIVFPYQDEKTLPCSFGSWPSTIGVSRDSIGRWLGVAHFGLDILDLSHNVSIWAGRENGDCFDTHLIHRSCHVELSVYPDLIRVVVARRCCRLEN